ncbi:hypothetical protein [Anaerovibrio sp.]|uniref:hypothetical protein n=1 Tax=Anaerovibrio sp. TaxID=1872532 RepID=UPI00263003BB|nr:hypothetical protein [Anaerovibrio sp.]
MIKRNKVVKFALKMRDDYECRDLETLREYFDLEKAIAYFQDGRLITWMKHRGFYDIADELEEMSAEAAEFPQKLCSLLEVEYTGEAVDAEDIAFYNERLKEIKQYTNDEKILSNAGCIAITQEELGELLEEDVKVIYLLDGEYSIPIKRKNHKYIGIGNVTAKIRSKEPVDFDKLEIEFENISFDSEYESICATKIGSSRYPDTMNHGRECLLRPEALVEWFDKIANIVGGFYDEGANRWYMSDKIDDIAEKSFPSCTCVLYSSNKPRVGFGFHAMYFYDYDKVIRYENIEKISYGYKIILSYKDKSFSYDYSKEVISFAHGVSHSYEMAIFFDIIADANFLAGNRLNELCSIRLQSCNGKTVRDIIG